MAFVGLGISGGIGAYKAVEVARLLQKRGHRVQAVMTRTARRFVGPVTFEAITRERVITSQFAVGMNADIEHIALASHMDLLLVAPATANIIGKFANGIADDFLSALYLATRAPVLLAPAMNTNMWEHPAVTANVATLTARGVRFVDPGDGYLACGWVGRGRLAEPEQIVEAADRLLRPATALSGKRVLVTAGPTFEDLDPVRFLGNRSSGRMGFAIAAEAARRGAIVTLIAGPTTLEPPSVHELVRVRSAREMHAAVLGQTWETWVKPGSDPGQTWVRPGSDLGQTPLVDVVIMAAAVADYTPTAGASPEKIEKAGAMSLALERTPDILAELGDRRRTAEDRRPVLVGFAAQTGDPVSAARRKLDAKHVDLIVANDVSAEGAGFDVDTNVVSLVSHESVDQLPLMAKTDVAGAILDRVERLLLSTSIASVSPA